jgi:hypothetical protein
METLVSGSVEYLSVRWSDRRNLVTQISALSPTFDVLDAADTPKQSNVPCLADGMQAYCLVDTATGGNWASGIYRLYVRFSATPELPVHGPFPFKVEVR